MKTIEEIMGLIDVLEVHIESAATYCAKDSDDRAEAEYLLAIGVKKVIESALRELVERKPLSGKDRNDLVCNWFAEDWAKNKALSMLDDYESYQNISITK